MLQLIVLEDVRLLEFLLLLPLLIQLLILLLEDLGEPNFLFLHFGYPLLNVFNDVVFFSIRVVLLRELFLDLLELLLNLLFTLYFLTELRP